MMTDDQIRGALEGIARDLHFQNVEIQVERNRIWIHILFATSNFEGKSMSERKNIMWREFENRLDDETLISITQCHLMTPAEREETLRVA